MNQKILLCLLVIFFYACTNSTENKSPIATQTEASADTVLLKKRPKQVDEADSLKTTKTNVKGYWLEPIFIADTVQLVDNWYFNLKKADSVQLTNYWLDKSIIDSLRKNVNNSHRLARLIEAYQLEKLADSLVKEDSTQRYRYLKLDDGSWMKSVLNGEYDEAGATFEYYFPDWHYYSLRIQYGEGNGYRLVNSKTGIKTSLGGRPYFSPKGKYVLGINMDIEAQYSFNGIELFLNSDTGLKRLGRYSPEDWGVVNAMWISESQAILHCQSFDYSENGTGLINFFLNLEVGRYTKASK